MRTFTVNGKEYKAKPIEFDTVCDLEDMGVSVVDAEKKSFSLARAYFAICAGKGNDFAEQEIQKHVVSGGNLKDIFDVLNAEMERSDFFRAIRESQEENIAEGTEEETAEETNASEAGETE